ncbi:MAG TPA: S8/S53 family peptidase, partial [Actinomycetota bacterium]|nr:S8/S53 family peptidase [Actinomycetota bacterium]
GATGIEDLDVTFYSDMEAPATSGAATKRSVGGETGIVPAGTTHAIVTLFTGAEADFVYRAWAPVAARPGRTAPLPALPKPGIHASYGKSASPLATALKRKSHVVIALVDTGINPYHSDFRRPELVVHPSQYIEGFPKTAPALGLRLGSKDYVAARNADDGPVWSKVKERSLYWIPGTNVIGAYAHRDYYSTLPVLGSAAIPGVNNMPRPIIDDAGHGTGVASVSAGAKYGSNPEALIVVVEGFGTEAVEWASKQPWIDFISGSYGDPAAVPYGDAAPRIGAANTPAEDVNDEVGEIDSREYEHTGPFVLRDGRTACFSAGNGLSRTGLAYDRYSSLRPTSGPSWIITVGAASPRNDQNYGWHSWPVDVSSYGMHWPAATHTSTDGTWDFSGTSSATPVTCGVFSKALLEARKAMGDTREGIHVTRGTRVPAAGKRGRGLLADGVLTRAELHEAVLKTALPGAFDPVTFSYEPISTIPDTPVAYTQQGYGVANKASARRAVDVILGRAAMPDRSDVDRWIAAMDVIRDAIWNPANHGG